MDAIVPILLDNQEEDNTQEDGASESPTPMLDAEVDKYASLLNRR